MKMLFALMLFGAVNVPAVADVYLPHLPPIERDFSYRALEGIERVALRFRGFYHDFDRYGVNPDTLRAHVTQRLASAGIDVVPLADALIDPKAALLSVDLHANYSPFWGYAYSVSVKIHNKQSTGSSPQGFVGRVVWNEGDIGIGQNHNLSYINNKVMTLVDRLIADLRSRNS